MVQERAEALIPADLEAKIRVEIKTQIDKKKAELLTT